MEDAVPILNMEHLARLRELVDPEEPQALAELVHRYLASIPPQLEDMRQLLAAGKAEALEHEAHGLAGSSGMYGMPRVRQCSQKLQARARRNELRGAEELLADVERAFEEARPRLLAELLGPAASTPKVTP
ncbi:Hpt domain-containing protein [Archangium lipolyticum]|uniref:Hpt domain-containing protein n=1 Tax=Archangium lipolyticum TaxID=2970465 RepID=UPI002149B5F1|nr:Hpt domain-containing protein [Archangium lipolyticum]